MRMKTATYQQFATWMDKHDQGPRSITVGQLGREFPGLSYTTICRWIRQYRTAKEGTGQ